MKHAERERLREVRREAIDNLVRAASILAEVPTAEGDASAMVLAGIAVLKIAEVSTPGSRELAVDLVQHARGPGAADEGKG